MPVVLGPAKVDNEAMGEMGKRTTVNSSDRRCIAQGSAQKPFRRLVSGQALGYPFPQQEAILSPQLTIENILAPLVPNSFLAQDFTRKCRLVRSESRDRFSHLITCDEILSCISNDSFDPRQLTLVTQGRNIARGRFCLPAKYPGGQLQAHRGMLEALLSAGTTMLVSDMHQHHPNLQSLAQTLMTFLDTEVSINIYVGQPSSKGFDLHVDHHDVFILQVEGQKEWFVAEPTHRWPLKVPEHNGPPPDAISWSGILNAGDVLYLPRGYWHRAQATSDQPTLHLTCGVQPNTGLHILRWLQDELMQCDVFRQDLPPLTQPEAVQEHMENLKTALSQAWDPNTLTRYKQYDRKRRDNIKPLQSGERENDPLPKK
jgi:ribosomal protein L16 Arg81 hydroxylase